MMYKIISRTLILITALFLFTSIEVSAKHLIFFDDEALFNNTCPDLAVEDFEDTKVGPNTLQACPNPFNSLTNSACYSPGALIPGFSMNGINPPVPALPLVVFTPNIANVTNVAAGAQGGGDDETEVIFNPTVTAVGIVVVTPDFPGLVDVNVFGIGDVLLGTATVNLTNIDGSFLGIATLNQITRIELVRNIGDIRRLLYELSFGQCDLPRTPIPTLSEWGLIAMAGVLGIVGFMVLRRRKVTA